MPRYKLGVGSFPDIAADLPVRRPLICESCAEALGNVQSPPEHRGLSAYLVAAMWPEMQALVERHESECPFRG